MFKNVFRSLYMNNSIGIFFYRKFHLLYGPGDIRCRGLSAGVGKLNHVMIVVIGKTHPCESVPQSSGLREEPV